MSGGHLEWVVLTVGDRPDEADAAVRSVLADGMRRASGDVDTAGTRRGLTTSCILVLNGADVPPPVAADPAVEVVDAGENLGVPGGRHLGVERAQGDVVAFLDDDAVVVGGTSTAVLDAFADDPRLGALAMRIVDEDGQVARHFSPHLGRRGGDGREDVTMFVGAGHALRTDAYREVGGYFTDIVYGHEEIELCWRLVDAGWRISYEPAAVVFHPRIEIGRRPSAWYQTGRNRVRIARRTLPWPVAYVHVGVWLVAGWLKAPAGEGRSGYVRGWRRGWRDDVDRSPISWRGVWRLARLGRPPII